MNKTTPQRGFILITGMIFLIVITLLALSTLGSSTLQEKMTSNMREKSRALQAADAALRDGEARVVTFQTYQPPGDDYDYDPTPLLEDSGDEIRWRLMQEDGPLANVAEDGYLNPRVWGLAADGSPLVGYSGPEPSEYTPPFDTSLSRTPQLYVEETSFNPDGLSTDAQARAEGSMIYRVTSRAQGGTASAIAVTQSQYRKRY